MFTRILQQSLLAASLCCLVATANAAPFDDAVAAYDRGEYAQALKIYRPLAAKGDASAQFNLGVMYSKGLGATQDYKEAVKWYRKSETRQSQYKLGLCYENGNGVPKDEKEALDWYKKSADQNYEDAKKALERMKSK